MNLLTIVLLYGSLLLFFGTASLIPIFRKGLSARICPLSISIISLLAAGTTITLSFLQPCIPGLHFEGWQLPFTNFSAGIDQLSTLFLIPLMLVTFSSALFGPSYLAAHPAGRMHWFFFSLLVVAMTAVLLAKNAFFFIISWETMSLAAYVLIVTANRESATIKAGWIFMVMAHVGTALLLALFFYIGSITGSYEFSVWNHHTFLPFEKNVIFILSLCAFGCKAGFIPFHLWLPLAHPAAPAHVSALLSGIMIKMGVYGIIRMLSFLAPFHAWWGITLVIIGGISALGGILFALGQQSIKRMLAFSSIENIGIIGIAAGLGISASASHEPTVTLFAFSGMFFHIISHSLFKSMLFLGAGTVIHATGTGDINRLGGLIKSMRTASNLFLIGTAALCGLPLMSGFIGELFIYTAGITGAIDTASPLVSLVSMAAVIIIALTGGLAITGFTALFGAAFLGEKRSEYHGHTEKPGRSMITAMTVPAVATMAIGIGSFFILPWCLGPVGILLHRTVPVTFTIPVFSLAFKTSAVLFIAAGLALITALMLRIINRKKNPPAKSPTWDCGYIAPDASMQYTSTSFSAPAISFFRRLVMPQQHLDRSTTLFPEKPWRFRTIVDDWFITRLLAPLSHKLQTLIARLHWLQNGKSEQYVFYIVITVTGIILWKLVLK